MVIPFAYGVTYSAKPEQRQLLKGLSNSHADLPASNTTELEHVEYVKQGIICT